MQGWPAGAMLAVSLPESELQPLLAGTGLSVAGVNSEQLCTVSGPADALEEFAGRLAARDVTHRRLHTSHAFHSAMMDPILAPFVEQLKKVKLNAPRAPYVSNLTGTWVTDEQCADPNYWAAHLRQAVRFADGLGELLKSPGRVLLEVGPGQTLSTFARQHKGARGRAVIATMRHPHDETADELLLLESLGRLWLAGKEPDWAKLHKGGPRRRVPLPTYPFERQRYWVERQEFDPALYARRHASVEKRPDVAEWFYVPFWKQHTPPELLKATGLSDRNHNWLVFVDELGLGRLVIEQLEAQGQHVISVEAGQEFGRRGERAYTINPRGREDYVALLRGAGAGGVRPEKIIHLWSVTPEAGEGETGEAFERCQERGFYSLLFLAQALGSQNAGAPVQLCVVSSGMQEVTADDRAGRTRRHSSAPAR